MGLPPHTLLRARLPQTPFSFINRNEDTMGTERKKIGIAFYRTRGMLFIFMFILSLVLSYVPFIFFRSIKEGSLKDLALGAVIALILLSVLLLFLSIRNFMKAQQGYEAVPCPQCGDTTLVRKGNNLQCHRCWGVIGDETQNYAVKRGGSLERIKRYAKYAQIASLFAVFFPLSIQLTMQSTSSAYDQAVVGGGMFLVMLAGATLAIVLGRKGREGCRPEPCPHCGKAAVSKRWSSLKCEECKMAVKTA